MAKTKILLVDDTKLILELEKSFLKFSRVEIMTAANGIEALDLIRRDPPDLIFMDMNMPAMDGISCCKLLKADPFLCSIPVVMLTTAGRDGDRERALKAGCDDYITKPIDRREFLEKARKYTEEVERRVQRTPCHFPVIFLLGKSPIGAHAMDISAGGLFLATHEPIRTDRPLKLVFYLPGANPILMELLGTVAWINEEGLRVKPVLPAGFGVQFQDMEEKETAILEAFMEAEEQSRSGHEPS